VRPSGEPNGSDDEFDELDMLEVRERLSSADGELKNSSISAPRGGGGISSASKSVSSRRSRGPACPDCCQTDSTSLSTSLHSRCQTTDRSRAPSAAGCDGGGGGALEERATWSR
jgi:hypothetical protein